MLENNPWFIRNNLLIVKKWNMNVNLLKEDVVIVPVWVKLYGVLVTAFSEDGLSAIATKLGIPLMLDSYNSDMCIQSWGRLSNARAMIKKIGSDVAKNLKNPSQAPKGVPVGPKLESKQVKQVYRPVSKKNNVNTNDSKKKDEEYRKVVRNLNPFDVLNSVENDIDLGTNKGASNLASKETNFSGSSFWNVGSSSISTTPIVEKIDKLEKLIIDEKITLADDVGKPMKYVDYLGDHDSEDEVEPVDNEMTSFLASDRFGYSTNSLLKQWRRTYENANSDYDQYNDDMYEGREIQ
ncbi:reverse transcriptase domain-containing protein [Tanacetum coccineum]